MYNVKKVRNLDKANGTHRMGCIRATYQQLVKILGRPNDKGDGYKTSGEWVLQFGFTVVTVYDWKQTRLYDERLPTVEEFRAQKQPITFNVGGHDEDAVRSFIESLSHELDLLETKPAERKTPTNKKLKAV